MWGKKWNKNDLIALLIALAIHAGLIVLILFIVLSPAQLHERGGILVNIGDVEFASGDPAQGVFEPDADAAPPVLEEQPAEETLLTQESPEAPSIETPPDNHPTPEEVEAQRRREAAQREEQRRRAAEEEAKRKRDQISKAVSGAFGNAAKEEQGGAGSTPEAPTVGKEGSTEGNVPNGGANTGVGGFGSYDLGGRSIMGGGLPRPSYNAQVEGTIRIKITVDPTGKVIRTAIAPGTTIDDYQMQSSALKAAAQTRFNAVDTSLNQEGYITYRYQLR
ncbi:MAG: TonB family protein [Porphyromonas sp.]|nr:TonB family protein [Porphyromonas sp.]